MFFKASEIFRNHFCHFIYSAILLYFVIMQLRFSENKIWEIEENQTPPQTDSIEMVECYNDPQRNQQQQQKTPKLNTLPTLSISVPSPSPPYENLQPHSGDS